MQEFKTRKTSDKWLHKS